MYFCATWDIPSGVFSYLLLYAVDMWKFKANPDLFYLHVQNIPISAKCLLIRGNQKLGMYQTNKTMCSWIHRHGSNMLHSQDQNESLVEDFQFWDSYTTLWHLKNAIFGCKSHIRNGYLLTVLWAFHQCWKQYKAKEFELFLCQYLKNNICDVWLIPLEHVTNRLNFCISNQWEVHTIYN